MKEQQTRRMILEATKAKDLMQPNPVSIEESASIREGVAFLVGKKFSAAPVIDHAGRPVGVVSGADILVHHREKVRPAAPPDHYHGTARTLEKELLEGLPFEEMDRASIKDIMTPVVYSISLDAPVTEVIQQLLGLKVHRLFVVDKDGVLVGVISSMDVLRHLRPENGDFLQAPETASGDYVPHYCELW
jgi:CBS domain-containing protein